jgi:hypothetical protein
LIQKQVFKLVPEEARVSFNPIFFRLLSSFPILSRIMGRLVGLGFQPEHLKSPDVLSERAL